MKTVILAGGKGTRLRSITNMPKPLIEINGKNILEHLFDLLRKHTVAEVVLAVGYKADVIREYFEKNSHGIQISYVEEEEPLGTAGCLNLLGSELNETFLMSNGDELKDFDVTEMVKFHRRNKALATIALWEVEDPSHYGVAKLDLGRIQEFVEKPSKGKEPSKYINSGFYVLEPEIIDLIKDKKFAMMEKDVFPKLAEEGKLYGYKFEGQWFDIGTPERLEKAKREWRGVQ